MSKEQAVAFFEEISKNTQLAQEVEKVVGEKNADEAKAKELISLAQRYNFKFTPDEAAVAQGELKKPLSPEEMIEVSGGKLNLKSSLMALTLLAGLGVGGAAMTNMEARAMKRNLNDRGDSSKKGIIERMSSAEQQGQTVTNGNQQQTTPQTEPGAQQQTPPQPLGTANPTQNETPPGNGQGAAPSHSGQTMRRTRSSRPMTISSEERHAPKPPKEKKVRKNIEHDKKASDRYDGVYGCGPRQVEWTRRVSSTGALPAATWPAAPSANLKAKKKTCRFCGGTLSARGKKARDVKCSTDGCIYNWVFPSTSDAKLKGNQRGQLDYGHYARWALLPALILDSRLPTVGRGNNQRPRPAAIITPAEAWAVRQLIVGHNNGWADVRTMMASRNVDLTSQNEVVRLLEESYGNLVRGNESFIDLGSEVQQLVAGYNDSWQQVRTTIDLLQK